MNATFIGVHDFDDRLPDFSKEGVDTLGNEMKDILERSTKFSPTNKTETIDLSIGTNFLEIQLHELESLHFQKGNPATYSSEAIFGLISLCLRDFAPPAERLNSMIKRMERIPDFLEIGEQSVGSAPQEWTREAARQCGGAIRFLKDGVKILIEEWNAPRKLQEEAERSAKAFRDYWTYLTSELIHHDRSDGYGCGGSFFTTLIRKGHFEDMDAEKVASYGWEHLEEYKELLSRETKKLRQNGDWEPVISSLAEKHPKTGDVLSTAQKYWEDCKSVATRRELVTWPDYPIEYKFIPEIFREAAPHLYFLYYRSPSPFDKVKMNYYLLPPVDVSMTAEEQEKRLRGVNYTAIKDNHVVHHGALGHHIQNYYAYHSMGKLSKIASVDCASRIAMFCGGTMAEGWATYASDLMDEVGFNSPEEHIAHLHSKTRLTARAVVDASLHAGQYSFDDAVKFYMEKVGMNLEAARSEVMKNSMFPATGSMYLLGNDGIHELREKVSRRQGGDFNLRRFHDEILSYGSVPVALIAKNVIGN